jgi:RNase P/RNase MRP subunit p30
MFSILNKEIINAKRFDVPVIISSGAQMPLHMREPRGLAAVLKLLGYNEEESLDAVSLYPMNIVKSNRGKLDPNFIFPGVRRV